MKRILFFIIILIILFATTIWLSIQIFPEWIDQPTGFLQLPKRIIITGLILVGEAILAWAFSFLVADEEFKERVLFRVGNKYKEISRKLDQFTQSELNKEKHSKKYIPNVFVETTEIKEKLRYFSEPFVFFSRIIDRTDQKINGSIIIKTLKRIHFPYHYPPRPKIKWKIRSEKLLNRNVEKYKKHLDQYRSITSVLQKNDGVGLLPDSVSEIPPAFTHIYEYTSHDLQFYSSFEHAIDDAKDDLDLLSKKLVIIKSVAGHGKTNLLCDFTEKFLLKKKHKCLYIPAREFNYLGEQETIEAAISRIIFSEFDYQFSDILRLIKFEKSIENLFILIDGINEHKNMALFSAALEQFIQRSISYNVKIILTCRSEYFNDRFGNLLSIDNISVIDMDEWKYTYNIPDVYQNALISGYFTEFNIQMTPDKVSSEITEAFYKDKLLLRIFCEAFENERPAEYLDNLYRFEIFHRYHKKNLNAISGLDISLTEIIAWILNHDEFNNIPIKKLSKETNKVIEKIANENVILRKDIIAVPGLAFGRSEVINFVYDEFRDFLIASQMLLTWDQDNQLSREQIHRITKASYTVSEGVQKYLCLWAITNNDHELSDYLSTFSRFDSIFVDSVFDVPDSTLSDYFVAVLQSIFVKNPKASLEIFFNLVRRRTENHYQKLNIDLLILWISALEEPEYQDVLSEALNEIAFTPTKTTSYLAFLCNLMLEAFQENKLSKISAHNFILLLSYLAGVRDLSYPRYNAYDFGPYPARDAILDIGQLVGNEIVLKQVNHVYEMTTIGSLREKLIQIRQSLEEE
jgi:hypothetical protein